MTINVSVYSIKVGFSRHYTAGPMLFPSGNPFKCHEEVLYLQPLIPRKRFDIFSPLTGGCSEGLGAFWFFFKNLCHNIDHIFAPPPPKWI